MDPKDQLRIQQNFVSITNDLEPEDILPSLYQDGTITYDQWWDSCLSKLYLHMSIVEIINEW